MSDEKRDASNLTPSQLELRKAIALHRMPDPIGRVQLAFVNAMRRGSKKHARPEAEIGLVTTARTSITSRKVNP